MRENELRIGNWVRHYDSWSYRQPEYGPSPEFDFQWSERDWYAVGEACIEVDKIRAITIDSEWLDKFGFTCTVLNFRYEKGQYMLEEWMPNQGEPFIFRVKISSTDSIMLTEIEHVHQLQNLYFALTGEELIGH